MIIYIYIYILEPSEGDESTFKNFELNIIVGKHGEVLEDRHDIDKVNDVRYPAIRIYNSKSIPLGEIKKEEAYNMLNEIK